jgi:protein phosphatase
VSVSDGEFPTPGAQAPAIDVCGTTHRGKVRAVNEDQFLVALLRKSMHVQQTSLDDLGPFARFQGSSAYLVVVADGLGGLGGGRLASRTAVETLAEQIGETTGRYYSFDVDEEREFLAQLRQAVERAHDKVRETHPSADQGPATTLTLAALTWPRAYLVHVGDSRAYSLRGGQLRQLTRDQTVYEDLVDEGVLSEDQPGYAGPRNELRDVLTSAVGFELSLNIGRIDLQAGDVILLCTDGLTKHVSDSEIAVILGGTGSAEEACRRLVDLTLERGASDNVTVVVSRLVAR